MRRILAVAFFVFGILTASNCWAQGAQKSAGVGVTGRWIVNADFYGTPINYFMELVQQGDKLDRQRSAETSWRERFQEMRCIS